MDWAFCLAGADNIYSARLSLKKGSGMLVAVASCVGASRHTLLHWGEGDTKRHPPARPPAAAAVAAQRHANCTADVKGSTGEHAVANTVVVYAYNTWYPCTVYVHVYTLYVHVYAKLSLSNGRGPSPVTSQEQGDQWNSSHHVETTG
jgi:hypothetical protein